ncbi:MAG: hypothetical protein KF689_02375 [Gemmatimonadaceae bacterium]|nr:hypothetical protein [Gemmatimonadaceae bacterium]MCW5826782.1 hypothetical protein [Gemmatimonadaceae bacterium]
MLLQDKEFKSFLDSSSFEMVVGVDAITTPKAISLLAELMKVHAGLRVKAFVHERKGSIFHPKVSWFAGSSGGALLAGSGNLTVAGLRANWEAFAQVRLDKSQLKSVRKSWDSWVLAHKSFLRDLTDPLVAAAVASNKSSFAAKPILEAESGHLDSSTHLGDEVDSVLLAEIPKGSTRWNQANFSRDVYTGYFGAKVGSRRRIVLQHVNADGSVDAVESRPSVDVASHNFRFELGAASGLNYPAVGRPTAVFIKTQFGTILYSLVMPDDARYDDLQELLNSLAGVTPGRMRRVTIGLAQLQVAVPSLPILSVSSVED